MTEYNCTECDWSEDVAPTDQPAQYCPECGKPTSVTPDYGDLSGENTLSDKL